jgi:hypothetical protein
MRWNMPKTLKMKVDNTGFLVDRMGKDCAPLQYVRELTQNAIEAILRAGRTEGLIVWEADSRHSSVPKLSVTDNGDGMTGEEMIRYINTLSSSGARQAFDGNYGVGAKIAAATKNPAGLLYLSWKEGREGEGIQLVRDATGQYGLISFEDESDFAYVAAIPKDVKPEAIEKAGSGTRIVLMGESGDHDTCAPPDDAGTMAAQWVRKYLNTRYFRLPKTIKIQCQDYTPGATGGRRPVTGQGPMLDAVALAQGTTPLDGAVAHWWILPAGDAPLEKAITLPGVAKQATSMQTFGPGYQNRGHVAFLYRNEIYDLSIGNAAFARLHQCGVIFGADRVVVYMEPTSGDITTNTARTQLIVNGNAPPWFDWAQEFREKLPDAIREFIESFEAKRAPRDAAGIRDRIKEVLELFPVPKYVQSKAGDVDIDDENPVPGNQPRTKSGTREPPGPPDPNAKPRPPRAARGLKPKGPRGEKVLQSELPMTLWKFLAEGTRVAGEMEDKAAKFDAATNTLHINGDFRGFVAWVDYFAKQYPSIGGVRETVREQVMIWWEQALLEAVLAHQDFKKSPHWEMQELTDEALTMAVLPRYHIFNALKRGVRTVLGKPEVEVSAPVSIAPLRDVGAEA